MLPEAGQKLALHIPCSGADPSNQHSLSAILAAQPGLDQAPSISLCIVPHAVLHNSLPFAVTLACSGLPMQATAALSSARALDWGPVQHKPKTAVLALRTQQGLTLHSDSVALDSEHHTQLSFTASHQGQGPLPQQGMTAFLAAVKVHIDTLGMRPAALGTSPAGPMEVLHITITPACFVTNLTNHSLQLQLLPATAQSRTEAGTANPKPVDRARRPAAVTAARRLLSDQSQREQRGNLESSEGQIPGQAQQPWAVVCPTSQTVPILNAWRFSQTHDMRQSDTKQGASLPKLALQVSLHSHLQSEPIAAARNAPGNTTMLHTPLFSSQMPAPQHELSAASEACMQVVSVPSDSIAASDAELQSSVMLTRPVGRRQLHLHPEDEQSPPVTLTCCNLLSQGRYHLVFFTDPQPPVLLENATGQALSAAWFVVTRDAQEQQQPVGMPFSLPAGARLQSSPLLSLLPTQTGRQVR